MADNHGWAFVSSSLLLHHLIFIFSSSSLIGHCQSEGGGPASSELLIHQRGLHRVHVLPISQATEARQLFAYRSYRDVQLLHYSVPELTSKVSWEFRSNSTRKCPPKQLELTLHHSGFPLVNPDNSSYPPKLVIQRPYSYSLTLNSDDEPVQLNVSVPLPGDWFAVAYVQEDTHKIVQKGLFRDCNAWLRSSVKYYQEETVFPLLPNIRHSSAGQHYFRFFAPENSWSALVTVSDCATQNDDDDDDGCPVALYGRALALPDTDTFDSSTNCSDGTQNGSCQLHLVPAESSWNYIMVEGGGDEVQFQIRVDTVVCQHEMEEMSEVADVPQLSNSKLPKFLKPKKEGRNNNKKKITPDPRNALEEPAVSAPEALRASPLAPAQTSCWPQVPLARNNLPGNFAFRFDQVPDENGSTPLLFNVSSEYISLLKFDLLAIADSGGTLAVEMILDPFKTKNESSVNVSVTGCLEHSLRPRMSVSGECESSMSVQVNSTKGGQVAAIIIPYPEAGRWYLSLFAKCFAQNLSEEVECSRNLTSVLLQIKSTPCLLGQCGHYGNCYQYISGGFLFSTCVCKAGWKGWGCTDNRDAQSNAQLLLAVLLLTLSNIAFLPAIILAVYRKYFTEALVYLATMLFSTMYHACDSEVYSFCIFRLSVLQFCDFYSAILSVWVTLLAMAELPNALLSLAHMAGAVGVALGVEYDRTGLWVFAVPVAVGLIIMIISWVHHCSRQRSCYPRGRTWLACLLPGVCVAGGGLALFAFLETRSNYQYVHSAWHAAMAISILFLLPERRKVKGRDKQINTCSYVRVEELSDVSNPTTAADYEASEHLIDHN